MIGQILVGVGSDSAAIGALIIVGVLCAVLLLWLVATAKSEVAEEDAYIEASRKAAEKYDAEHAADERILGG